MELLGRIISCVVSNRKKQQRMEKLYKKMGRAKLLYGLEKVALWKRHDVKVEYRDEDVEILFVSDKDRYDQK